MGRKRAQGAGSTSVRELLADLSDCIACVDLDGKPGERFDKPAYAIETADTDHVLGTLTKLSQQSSGDGILHAYRFQNLGAARAVLMRLRADTQTLPEWEGPQSREATMATVVRYIDLARQKQANAAARTVEVWTRNRRRQITQGLWMVGGVAVTLLGSLVVLPPWGFLPESAEQAWAPIVLLCGTVASFGAMNFTAGVGGSSKKKHFIPLDFEEMKEMEEATKTQLVGATGVLLRLAEAGIPAQVRLVDAQGIDRVLPAELSPGDGSLEVGAQVLVIEDPTAYTPMVIVGSSLPGA